MSHNGTIKLDPMRLLAKAIVEYAAALLEQQLHRNDKHGLRASNDYTLAEIVLLNSLLSLLRDWFSAKDRTPKDSERFFPGRLHVQGKKPARCDVLSDRKRSKVHTRHGRKRRGNGQLVVGNRAILSALATECARRYGRSEPSQDRALGYYTEFRGFPLQAQQKP
ncbi:MAG: hypothetical protein ACLT98_07705 [Eggerthellaceae bacterium]